MSNEDQQSAAQLHRSSAPSVSLESFRSPNAILYALKRKSTDRSAAAKNSRSRTLVFFLTGNPGLISYYDEFLDIIARPYDSTQIHHHDGDDGSTSSPDSSCLRPEQEQVIVAGFSLGGFTTTATTTTSSKTPSTSDPDSTPSRLEEELTFPPAYPRKEVYSLRDQIDLSYARLEEVVRRIREYYHPYRGEGEDAPVVKAVLIGHSVGAYIGLELVRIHHLRSHGPVTPATTTATTTTARRSTFTISSCILLTPTILDISLSSSGRIATPVLSYLPFFPVLIQFLSLGLTSLISAERLAWLVGRITGMKEGSAGLKATVEFLAQRGMVRQALSMAGDEMREIGADRWGEEVWGVAGDGGAGVVAVAESGEEDEDVENGKKRWKAPRLYFLFAGRDHWVADLTREQILKGLAGRDGDEDGSARIGRGSAVVVDETDGLVHAWCLEQNEAVGKRVRGWIGEILDEAF